MFQKENGVYRINSSCTQTIYLKWMELSLSIQIHIYIYQEMVTVFIFTSIWKAFCSYVKRFPIVHEEIILLYSFHFCPSLNKDSYMATHLLKEEKMSASDISVKFWILQTGSHCNAQWNIVRYFSECLR